MKFMETAQKTAEENAQDGICTVVFFDEANTTEAIGLIKEIMCDRRLPGLKISDNMKFIAACNPYRKSVLSLIKTIPWLILKLSYW